VVRCCCCESFCCCCFVYLRSRVRNLVFLDGCDPTAIRIARSAIGNSGVLRSRLFHATNLLSMPLKGMLTAASSLTMAYSSWTKGTSALLLNVRALADAAGVGDVLDEEWNTSQPGLVACSANTPGMCGPKAWCWSGEMEEIAKAFNEAGLPGNFYTAAAEVYTRLSPLKGRERSPPNLDEAMSLLKDPKRRKV